MNPCLPDWNFESDLPFTSQKKPSGPNNDLVELLWQNGQVVMHSQTHQRPGLNHFDVQQLPQKQNGHHHHQGQPRKAGGGGSSHGSYGNSSVLIQDDETVSWIHYPVEDSFEKEFCSHFFSELPVPDAVETDKPILAVPDQSGSRPSCGPDSSRVPNPMPPPSQPAQLQFPNSAVHQSHGPTKAMDISQLSKPVKGDARRSNPHFGTAGDVRECSGMTVGSSHCGSNQVALDNPDFSRASSYGTGTLGLCSQVFVEDNIPETVPRDEGRNTETIEPTLTLSSGGSGSSLGRTQKNSAGTSSLKRKGRDAEDSDDQSQAAELESGGGKNPSQRSGSTRRSRAAEVHNLSERKRRDRINKKMKALQELIPHCSKTDKASMLDEAIEYLKSLQMQLQMMWIGSGMAAPMMFPGMQPYMSPMGIGMGPHPLTALHNNMNLRRVPMVDHQSMAMTPQNRNVICQAPVLNPGNFPNQVQNQSLTEQFACYMGMQQLQAAASQPMSMFRFSPQTMPTSQVNNTTTGASNDDASSGKIS